MTKTATKQIVFQFIKDNGKTCKVRPIDLPTNGYEAFQLTCLRLAEAREWALKDTGDRIVRFYMPNLGVGKHNITAWPVALDKVVAHFGLVIK